MRTSVALTALLAVVLPAAVARSDDLVHPDGVETTETWYRFSEQYAEQLITIDRIRETVEEYTSCSALHTREIDKLAEGAVLLVNGAGRLPGGLEKGSSNYMVVEDLIRAAVARGGKGDPRLAYAIGRLRFVDVDWPTAYNMFKDAYEGGHDPERTKRWYYRATVNRADMLIKAGRVDEAIVQLRDVIEDSAPDADWLLAAQINLAVAHRRREERVTAELVLRDLLKRYGDHPAPHNTLGQVLFDEGRLEEALEEYRTSMSLAAQRGAPTDDTLVSIAHVLYKLGQLDASEEALNAYLGRNRDSSGGLYLLAQLQRDRGETLEAIRTLRRAHRLNENDGSILLLLQQVHYERNEIAEAEAVGVRLEALRERLMPKRGGGDQGNADEAAQDPGGASAPDDGAAPDDTPVPTDTRVPTDDGPPTDGR